MAEQTYPFLKFILRHKKINLPTFIVATIALTLVVFLVIPIQYTSQVSILPSAASFSQGIAGKLGSLGKLAGIDLGGASGQSQEMFLGILTSRRLLEKIYNKEYEFEDNENIVKKKLVDYFEIDSDSERETNEKVLKILREDVLEINIDQNNSILYLDITTENPFLSAQVANYTIEILNEIVKSEVQKEFHQKLNYLEERIAEIEDSLKIAENNLKRFLETNTDPTLPGFQIEQLRLRRNLQIQTELYIEFRKQLEIFIADNMINLADIKVLDTAYPPYKKSRPKRSLLLITFVMLFGFVQVGVNGSIYIYKTISSKLTGNFMDG